MQGCSGVIGAGMHIHKLSSLPRAAERDLKRDAVE